MNICATVSGVVEACECVCVPPLMTSRRTTSSRTAERFFAEGAIACFSWRRSSEEICSWRSQASIIYMSKSHVLLTKKEEPITTWRVDPTDLPRISSWEKASNSENYGTVLSWAVWSPSVFHRRRSRSTGPGNNVWRSLVSLGVFGFTMLLLCSAHSTKGLICLPFRYDNRQLVSMRSVHPTIPKRTALIAISTVTHVMEVSKPQLKSL